MKMLRVLLRKELVLSVGFGFYALLLVKVIPDLVRGGDSDWAVVVLAMMAGLIISPILAAARRTLFLSVPASLVAAGQVPGLTVNLGIVGPKHETGESGLAWLFFKLSETDLGWPSAAIIIAGLVGYAWHISNGPIRNDPNEQSTTPAPAAAKPLDPKPPLELSVEDSGDRAGDNRVVEAAKSNDEELLNRRDLLRMWIPIAIVFSVSTMVASWVPDPIGHHPGWVLLAPRGGPSWAAALGWVALLLVLAGGVFGPIAIFVVRTVGSRRRHSV